MKIGVVQGLIIGMLFVGLVTGVFVQLLAQGNNVYSTSGNFNQSHFNSFQSLNRTVLIVDQAKTQAGIEKQDQNLFDLIGGFFRSGKNALNITFQSVSLFDDMVEDSVRIAPGGANLSPFKNVAIAVVTVIMVFLLIMILVKWVL